RFGPHSALYISFGTVFTPSERPDLVETLIETLLAADPPFPFIFASGYIQKSLSPEIRSRVQASGRGLLADAFVPQQAILKHAATGWFLSHGGSNSTNEAILNCVPLILWPFSLDQPIIP
ncbi:UDP-Glycosyltransferase/glycogen phosphorylase, partial [Fistulina hepatica ATCC 64428]